MSVLAEEREEESRENRDRGAERKEGGREGRGVPTDCERRETLLHARDLIRRDARAAGGRGGGREEKGGTEETGHEIERINAEERRFRSGTTTTSAESDI